MTTHTGKALYFHSIREPLECAEEGEKSIIGENKAENAKEGQTRSIEE